jgi:Fic family protein
MTQYLWQRHEWTNFRWKNESILSDVGECRLLQGKLLGRLVGLGLPLENHTQMEILTEETMKTSAIEGEKLSPKAVRSSVAGKLGLPSAGLIIDRHVDGLVSVLLDATKNHNEPLSVKRLCGWHAALFPTGYSGLHKIRAGKWRGDQPMQVVSGPLGREIVHFLAPPSESISSEINDFLKWFQESRGNMEGLLRAAIAHLRFVTIHPFEDGNGRIARALTDMAVAQDDGQFIRYYSLSSQIMAQRKSYYDVLENCQKGNGDITQWLVWFLDCFCSAINRSETLLATVLDRTTFWKTHDQKSIAERQRKVINRMLDAGRGNFEGGLTTRKYVSMANVSRATAFREIEQMVKLGLLKLNPGRGRSVNYDLNWDET